jgi:Flp pilus assembly pilin Flp
MRRMTGAIRRLSRCEGGAAAVEFAIIGMALIVITVGTVELGRAFYAYNKLSHAADVAARRVLTNANIDNTILASGVFTSFSQSEQLVLRVQVSAPAAPESGVNYTILTVTLPFKPLLPSLMTDTIDLQVTRKIPKIS